MSLPLIHSLLIAILPMQYGHFNRVYSNMAAGNRTGMPRYGTGRLHEPGHDRHWIETFYSDRPMLYAIIETSMEEAAIDVVRIC